jgi:hypothetical protein
VLDVSQLSVRCKTAECQMLTECQMSDSIVSGVRQLSVRYQTAECQVLTECQMSDSIVSSVS